MKNSKTSFFTRYGVLLITICIAIAFSLSSKVFLNLQNINMLLVGQVIVGFFAFAALAPLAAGEFDISLGNLMGFVIMFGATVARAKASPLAVLLSMIGMGIAGGVFNGFIAVTLRVPSTISTLGTGMLFYGFSMGINDGMAITASVPAIITSIAKTRFLGFNISVWILAIFALLFYYLLEHTPFGKNLYVVGLSEKVAYLAGIRTKMVRFMTFVIAGFFVSVGSIILLGQSGNAYPTTGPSYLLPGLAVVFFSITTHIPGRFNVPGVMASLLMLGVTFNGISILGAPFWTEAVVNGLILLIVVLTTNIEARKVNIG